MKEEANNNLVNQYINTYIITTLIICMGLFTLAKPINSHAQLPTALKGKRVGVYVSKKNLKFTSDFYQILASFISQNDTIGLSTQDIYLGMSVRLGYYMGEKLHKNYGTDTSFFINESPKIAQSFIKAINHNGQTAAMNQFIKLLPAKMDYILIVESVNCQTENRSTVATYSNQIFTQKRKIKKVEMTIKLLDLSTGKTLPPIEANFDEEQSITPVTTPPPAEKQNYGTQFMSKVIDLSLFLLASTMPQ